ncbi:ATP-binding cassette domain-containing protein [Erysipelothrix inopinata]|uniref:ATP-binding cassette domain-containing protein n=1 Tax=Erysipelothrix inopinata TaxID=225084 RepID=A0A7G9RW68_9FIRM|nr:ATP-binding cassette domain-containing protein [Erysipelothrix inopinata]QNN59843.1 ATP-binding cassette domain-containing protein [Erysipelothrix inopinata]
MTPIIQLKDVNKSYNNIPVLENFNLEINEGEMICISGRSGSGKSTILNILGLLETFDGGTYLLYGKKAPKPFSNEATKILKDSIGYLFQNFALIDNKTVRYNLELALSRKQIKDSDLNATLDNVGLIDYLNRKVYTCSGGEQQRIAIARLLLKDSNLILCDEPTGSLDDENKHIVMNLLHELHQSGKTVIIVTHDTEIINATERVVYL